MNHLPGIGVFFSKIPFTLVSEASSDSYWCFIQKYLKFCGGYLWSFLFNSKDEHGGNCQNGDVASIFEDLLYQIMFDLHGKNMEGERPFYGSYWRLQYFLLNSEVFHESTECFGICVFCFFYCLVSRWQNYLWNVKKRN